VRDPLPVQVKSGGEMVQVKLEALLGLPAVSLASTANVWLPWLRPE
jgi:hypothetical protein